jgi:hypothetical protein
VPEMELPLITRNNPFYAKSFRHIGIRASCVTGRHARCAVVWPVEYYSKGGCECPCHREDSHANS